MKNDTEDYEYCDECHEPILQDDEYLTFDGKCYCKFCLEEKSLEEVIGLFGYSLRRASIY